MVPESISTERLVLRRWSLSDAPALRAALDRSDAHLRPWIPFMAREPRSLAETRAWVGILRERFVLGEVLHFSMWRGADLVGEVLLMDRVGPGARELGYWLHVDHVGRGYAREAVDAMVTLAASLGVGSLRFHCDVRNAASNRIPERLGARRGDRVSALDPSGEPAQLQVWHLALPG
jgi:RimJ/RimL family protein N-acetyltransferase